MLLLIISIIGILVTFISTLVSINSEKLWILITGFPVGLLMMFVPVSINRHIAQNYKSAPVSVYTVDYSDKNVMLHVLNRLKNDSRSNIVIIRVKDNSNYLKTYEYLGKITWVSIIPDKILIESHETDN